MLTSYISTSPDSHLLHLTTESVDNEHVFQPLQVMHANSVWKLIRGQVRQEPTGRLQAFCDENERQA